MSVKDTSAKSKAAFDQEVPAVLLFHLFISSPFFYRLSAECQRATLGCLDYLSKRISWAQANTLRSGQFGLAAATLRRLSFAREGVVETNWQH
jgi:hypothetical protein